MSIRDDYFARVAPLLGRGLADHTLAVERPSLAGRVVELLAGCRLSRVAVNDHNEPTRWPLSRTWLVSAPPSPAAETLMQYMDWKNHIEPIEWLSGGAADAIFDARLCPPGGAPRIEWQPPRLTMVVPVGDLFAFQNLSYVVARELRDVLMERAPWPEGTWHFGTTAWPWTRSRQAYDAPESAPTRSSGKHVLVVGCGSVGSEVVRTLANDVDRWTLVDDATVSVFNPHRQWFGSREVGRSKVEMLARRLRPRPVRAVPQRLDHRALEALLVTDRPDLVLLTTGTNIDAELATTLWNHQVPHVVAYAYPQARFFEVTTVLPNEETPCLHCFRGNLFRGAPSPPPMTDEVSRFLYQSVTPEERDRIYDNLVAEPATPIDTGRLSDVMAQCALQAMAPTERRSAWFVRMLDAATTCLLGGNVSERHDDGEYAYGITYPGQVVRLGLEDIMGVEELRSCLVCGRDLEVRVPLELPRADDADIDNALVSQPTR